MPPPPTRPQPQNEIAQEGNGDLTIFTEFFDNETLAIYSKVVDDTEIVDPVRNSPAVAPFTLKIVVPPPLPPKYPPHVPPPLTLTDLPLITPLLYPYYLVAYTEDDVVVEFHQNKWKGYSEGTKLKPVTFCIWQLKTIFGESVFPISHIAKKMT